MPYLASKDFGITMRTDLSRLFQQSWVSSFKCHFFWYKPGQALLTLHRGCGVSTPVSIVGISKMSPFLWQGWNLCWMSLVFDPTHWRNAESIKNSWYQVKRFLKVQQYYRNPNIRLSIYHIPAATSITLWSDRRTESIRRECHFNFLLFKYGGGH